MTKFMKQVALVAAIGVAVTGCNLKTGADVPNIDATIDKTNLTAPTDADIAKYTAMAATHNVRITTAKGEIVLELFADSAPLHVANFMKLTEAGFYDGLVFHRVEPGFVVQGGDPLGSGMGGPGYTIKAEFNDRSHVPGVLAMARSGEPDSAGSQFYITLGDASFLDKNYTVFGNTVSGFEVVQKIAKGDVMTKVELVTK